MGPAALPPGAGQRGGDRVDQAAVSVRDDQPHPGKSAGRQRPQESQPAGPVLLRRDLQTEDFPLPVGVDADRDQGVHVDGAAGLPDLDGQRVQPHERVRATVQRPVTERLDLRVEVGGHLRDLRLGQLRHAELLNQLLHPPRRHPQQVRRGHHRHQGLLGAPAVPQQPIREVRTLPQLRDGQLDRAGSGVPLPRPIPIAGVDPLVAALPVRGTAQRIRLGAHQRLSERLHHRPQHVRARRLQLLAQKAGRVHTLRYGHRVALL